VDYSHDGVDERAIFSGGLATPGKGVQLEEVFQAGKGPSDTGGASGGTGLDDILFNIHRNPLSMLSSSSFGLEGLEAELDYFRSSKGYGVGHPLFSGSIGSTLPPVGQISSSFGPISLQDPAGFSGEAIGRSAVGDGVRSFSVGKLIGSEGLPAFPGVGAVR